MGFWTSFIELTLRNSSITDTETSFAQIGRRIDDHSLCIGLSSVIPYFNGCLDDLPFLSSSPHLVVALFSVSVEQNRSRPPQRIDASRWTGT
jgi:hypothetical protein